MICNKCGANIPENMKFCGNCGQKFENEPIDSKIEDASVHATNESVAPCGTAESESSNQGESYASQPAESEKAVQGDGYFAQPINPNNLKPRRRIQKRVFIICGVAIAVFVLLFACFGKVSGAFIKLFGSPEAYMKYVEAKALTETVNDVTNWYKAATDSAFKVKGAESELEINLSDEAYEMIDDLSGNLGAKVDLSWFKGIGLKMDVTRDGERNKAVVDFKLSGEDIVDFVIITGSDQAFVSIPGMTDKYLSTEIDMDETQKIYSDPELEKSIPSDSDLNKLLVKYIGIALDNLDKVSKTTKTIVVDDVEQKVTVLTLIVDDEVLNNIGVAVLSEMKKDKKIKSIITDIAEFASEGGYIDEEADEIYADFVESIDEALEALNDNEFDREELFSLVDYVDGSHRIVGRELEVEDEEIFSYKISTKGNKFATVVECGEFILEGSGIKSGNKRNGEFSVKVEENTVLEFTVDKFDVKSFKEALPKGSIRFELTKALFDELDLPSGVGTAVSLLDLALEFDFDCKDKSSEIGVSLFKTDDALLDVVVRSKEKSGGKVKLPKENDVIPNENVSDWVDTLDFSNVIKALEKAGVPQEYLDIFEEYSDKIA